LKITALRALFRTIIQLVGYLTYTSTKKLGSTDVLATKCLGDRRLGDIFRDDHLATHLERLGNSNNIRRSGDNRRDVWVTKVNRIASKLLTVGYAN